MDKKGKKQAKKRVVTVADAPPPANAAAALAAAAGEQPPQSQAQPELTGDAADAAVDAADEHDDEDGEADVADASQEEAKETEVEPEQPVAEAAAGVAALHVDAAPAQAQQDAPAVASAAEEVVAEHAAPIAEAVPEAAAAPSSAPTVDAAAAAAAPPAATPSYTTIDLLDWQVAEEGKGVTSATYVTFLFEICYRYPAEVLSRLQADLEAEGLDPHSFAPTATFVLAKRYAELHDFHAMLERHFVCLPPFPEKTLSSKFGRRTDKEFVSARAAALHHYLAQIFMRADIEKTSWPRQFIGAPSPAQHLRNERAKAAERRPRQQQQQQHDPDVPRSEPRSTSAGANGSATVAPSVHFHDAHPEHDHLNHHQHQFGVDHGGAVSLAASRNSATNLAAMVSAADDDDEPFIGSEANSLAETVPVSNPAHPLHKQHPASTTAALQDVDSDDDLERRLHGKAGGALAHGAGRKDSHAGAPLSFEPAPPSSPALLAAYAAYAASTPVCTPPRSVSLEFLTQSPVFSMLQAVQVDRHTLLVGAADQSVVAKASSFFSSLFGGSKKDDAESASATTYTSSSGEQVANPRGALFAFRRAGQLGDDGRINAAASSSPASSPSGGGGGDFVQTLSIFFPSELSALRWDAERRWIYVTDTRGGLSIFNPSSDFDYAVKLLTVPIFAPGNPVVAVAFAPPPPSFANGGMAAMVASVSPSSSSPALLLATSAEGGDKQLVARFDLNAQQVDRDFTMQFNAPRSANQNEGLNALEWDAAQRRMLVASSGRVISLYDCAASPSAPPTLLHRLLNGHEAAVQALALDTSPLLANGGGGAAAGMLASGGADGSVLLWNLGLKGSERTTTIWARLRAHVAPVTALAWSAPVGSGSIGPAAAAAASPASANVAVGRYLVSGDELGYVCVWDARRRGCIMAFRAHAASVRSLQISSTLEVLSASTDKSTKLWQLV